MVAHLRLSLSSFSRLDSRGRCPHAIFARLGVYSGRFGREQLPQHELQDSTVGIVLRFLRCVDTHQGCELCSLAVRSSTNVYLTSRREVADQITNAGDLENFFASQSQRLRGLPL